MLTPISHYKPKKSNCSSQNNEEDFVNTCLNSNKHSRNSSVPFFLFKDKSIFKNIDDSKNFFNKFPKSIYITDLENRICQTERNFNKNKK